MPVEYSDLERRMGGSVKRFGLRKGFNNAYCNAKGEVIVGEKLLDRLKHEHALAVIAHEFGHIKSTNLIKTFLTSCFFLGFYPPIN